MAPDPEDLLRSLEERVDTQTQRALQLSSELESAEVSLRSAGGEVTVRVNSAGGLAGLQIHPEAEGLAREELARLVVATSEKAQVKLAARVGELVSSLYRSGSSTAAFVTSAYASKYPDPDNEPGPR